MTDPNCHYNDGEHCRKGLPGTLCEVEGCVARMTDKEIILIDMTEKQKLSEDAIEFLNKIKLEKEGPLKGFFTINEHLICKKGISAKGPVITQILQSELKNEPNSDVSRAETTQLLQSQRLLASAIIMQGLVSNSYISNSKEWMAERAVEYADALIERILKSE